MSASDFCRSLSSFCETLIENDLALGLQSHVVRPVNGGVSRVSWLPSLSLAAEGDEGGYLRTADLELAEYLRCLRSGDYSLLLNDGGLIQVSLDFRGDDVVASRFCYIPCVVKFDVNEIRIEDEVYPIEDFILEMAHEELISRLCLRTPFRFEHDPTNASDEHALNHVHLGKSASRVPVSAAMCWDHFARFVFSNFYPDVFAQVSHLLRFPPPYRPRTITDAHSQEVHFAFHFAEPAAGTGDRRIELPRRAERAGRNRPGRN
ncbi:DUF2290 domain-containing protein [Sinorhizobium meliloti]|nr:DUF2290 domain-containing protein [Sinorhizobium meliloti]